MSIFNSLGSNYDFKFMLHALFATNDENYTKQLKNFLEDKYQGKAFLTYKGREALRLTLRIINRKGTAVAICGFTCFAVYDAVIKEGYKVEYLDIEKSSLNFSFETLKKNVEKNPQIKVVIIQNTLGVPCEIEKIAKFCKEKKITLIEDLAHSIGTVYSIDKETGNFGDFVVLSFSQDKIVDGVSGGALILRNKNFQFPIPNLKFKIVDKKTQLIDRLYPLFTYKIRKTYSVGVGKILHFVLRNLNLLSNPMSDSGDIHSLPNWYCKSIYWQFQNLEKDISHREKISSIYAKLINKKILSAGVVSYIDISCNIRFPIFVENRSKLIDYLRKHGIFVSDIWYDAPIAPRKYLYSTNYKNECPESEEISSKILNLPTHKNISENDAEYISKKINQWLISQ